MIEVELWDKNGIPLKYIQIQTPLPEICLFRDKESDGLFTEENNIVIWADTRLRRFKLAGRSADLTERGVSTHLVYKEI